MEDLQALQSVCTDLNGLSFSQAFRQEVILDKNLQSLVAVGKEVPRQAMVWLDALRDQKSPAIRWEVNQPDEEFGQCDPAMLTRDELYHLTLGLRQPLILSRLKSKLAVIDGFSAFRGQLHDKAKHHFHLFIDRLARGELAAQGINENHETREIDCALWSSSRVYIAIAASSLFIDDREAFHSITIRNPSRVAEQANKTKSNAGAHPKNDWHEIASHFIISLSEDDWPNNKKAARERVLAIMAFLGEEAPSRENTIDEAMRRIAGPMWDLFPSGKPRPDHSRFIGLTKKAPNPDPY